MTDISKSNSPGSTAIITSSSLRDFVLQCMLYFSKTPMWNNLAQYCEINEFNSPVKLYKKGSFNLPGMFLYGNSENVKDRNEISKRWHPTPFNVGGKTLFVTTQWVDSSNKKFKLSSHEFEKFIQDCFGSQYHMFKTRDNSWALYDGQIPETIETTSSVMKQDKSDLFSVKRVIEYINETGLIYSPLFIKRFVFSLLSKRFLILSGLAGSGKTQLALAFAKTMIENDDQMCVVSVGADWTNREPLLGYPNALRDNEYVKPDNGVLDLLLKAKDDDKGRPYFLILDEMNMSYVERYFADFLSSMESHEPIALWKGDSNVPQTVKLSDNLFIIGTINVDETTYMFSPKVLDRANVIEFKVSDDDMDKFLTNFRSIDRDVLDRHKGKGMAVDFVKRAKDGGFEKDDDVKDILIEFFKKLKDVNAEFGYRSAMEIYRYIHQAMTNDDTEEKISKNDIIDSVIVQKLMPKLHGSRKKLENILNALWKLCFDDDVQKDVLSVNRTNVSKAKYPLTADKIARMMDAALTNGFTSFAEA
jgi:5-methylcytosine-specific restriction protein B